jgi:hypothetical protein
MLTCAFAVQKQVHLASLILNNGSKHGERKENQFGHRMSASTKRANLFREAWHYSLKERETEKKIQTQYATGERYIVKLLCL